MKREKMVYSKGNRAITLIALVVTIIVLLILAGVTINTAVRTDGIIRKSKIAVNKYQETSENELQSLKEMNTQIALETYPEIELTGDNDDLIGITDDSTIDDLVIPETVKKDGTEYVVTSLGKYFAKGKHFKSITIPSTVKTIKSDSFFWCKIDKITIPKTVTKIEDEAFQTYYTIGDFEVDEESPILKNVDGIVYTKSGKTLVMATGKAPNIVTVLDGTETIGGNAFRNNEDIQKVKLPDGLLRLGGAAFGYCDSLTQVNLPSSLEDLGYSTFENDKNLEDIGGNTLPPSLTKIGSSVFENCSKLKNFTIPQSVTSVEMLAFSDDTISFENYKNLKGVEMVAFHDCTITDEAAKEYILTLNSEAITTSKSYGSSSISSFCFNDK